MANEKQAMYGASPGLYPMQKRRRVPLAVVESEVYGEPLDRIHKAVPEPPDPKPPVAEQGVVEATAPILQGPDTVFTQEQGVRAEMVETRMSPEAANAAPVPVDPQVAQMIENTPAAAKTIEETPTTRKIRLPGNRRKHGKTA